MGTPQNIEPWVDSLRKSCRDAVLAEAVIRSLRTLLSRDAHLLKVDAHENSITHNFAMYIKKALSIHDWNVDCDVDCEYSRNPDDPGPKKMKFKDQVKLVRPDVIVHKRGTKNNYVVFEFKKSNNPDPDDSDIEKLRAYCDQLGYQYGVFVRLDVKPKKPDVARIEFIHGDCPENTAS
jgi:hypothetical protein